MADEPVEKLSQVFTKCVTTFVRQGVDLGERLGQPMRNVHLSAPQLAHQLHVVIAGNAKSRARRHHVADQSHGVENARPSVHEIADENGFPALRMSVNWAAG
jgi:hypothetical protein